MVSTLREIPEIPHQVRDEDRNEERSDQKKQNPGQRPFGTQDN